MERKMIKSLVSIISVIALLLVSLMGVYAACPEGDDWWGCSKWSISGSCPPYLIATCSYCGAHCSGECGNECSGGPCSCSCSWGVPCDDDGPDGPDPCAGVSCPDTCVGNNLKYNGRCEDGDCVYDTKTCDYGCQNNECIDPDKDKTLCENKGFVWMEKECCGDDGNNDWGRVVYVSGEATDLLCAPGPKIVRSKDLTFGVLRPGQVDALSSGPNWYICDYNKNSDCNGNFDQFYNCQDGYRVDDTCRYSNSTFVCGGPKQSEQQFKVHSKEGTPGSLISGTHANDGKWSITHLINGNPLTSWGIHETIGSASSPLEVKKTGLDPNKEYKVEYEVLQLVAGKKLWIKRTDKVGYTKYDGVYIFDWGAEPLNFGTVKGVNDIGVQVYHESGGPCSSSLPGKCDTNLRNLIVTEVGATLPDPGGIQAPIVKFNHDYLCYSPADRPESFVECCGKTVDECNWYLKNYTLDGKEVKWDYKLAGQKVTVGQVEYMCASDGRYYNASDIENNPQLCKDMGYIWVDRMCCGNDPGETYRNTWLAKENGCCFRSDECLVSNAGNELNNNAPETYFTTDKGPHCIASQQYIMDNKCEEGVWSTRTKDIALHLHKVFEQAGESSYVMYCDNYSNVLTYYKYLSPTAEPIEETYLKQSSCELKNKKWPCVNNFCVISKPDGSLRVIGGTINYMMEPNKITDLLSYNTNCNSAIGNNDGIYHPCSDAHLWINNQSQGFIFSKDSDVNVPILDAGFFENFLRSPFQTLFAFIRSIFKPAEQYQFTENFIASSDRYDRIYVYNAAQKSIRARYEAIYVEGVLKEIMAINYTGFDSTAICTSVNRNYAGMCAASGDSAYIAGTGNYGQFNEIWQDMTSEIRVQNS